MVTKVSPKKAALKAGTAAADTEGRCGPQPWTGLKKSVSGFVCLDDLAGDAATRRDAVTVLRRPFADIGGVGTSASRRGRSERAPPAGGGTFTATDTGGGVKKLCYRDFAVLDFVEVGAGNVNW